MTQNERTCDTRRALINAATERLWNNDEGSLRVADISEDTGLSTSVIYSNFKSRQGLIDATYLDMYETLSRNYITLLTRNAQSAETKTSIIEYFETRTDGDEINRALRDFRRMRLRIATAAMSRENLRRSFIKLQEEHMASFAAMLEGLQDRGVIGRSLNARQLAVLLEGFTFGRALDNIAPNPQTNESWLEILLLILEAL